MPTPVSSRLQNRCVEAIALLSYLGKIHAPPTRHSANNPDPHTRGRRSLRYKDERCISSTLAYLSCTRDEFESATAVCVRDTSKGLCVMIAANANAAGPSPYLNSVKTGFDNIFAILNTASTSPRESIVERLFVRIVSLCRERIITRARLDNDPSRPNLEESLIMLRTGLSHMPTKKKDSGLADLITALVSLLDQYRRNYLHPPPRQLGEEEEEDDGLDRDRSLEKIIDKCYEISRIRKLDTIFQQAFNQITPKVNPLMPPALLDRIRKIAAYKKSASTLYELAKRYSSVRKASTLIISPKADAFPRPSRGNTPALLEVLQRISQSHQTLWAPQQAQKTISERLQKNPSSFTTMLKNLKADSKVHAEIQLAWYLEEHRKEMGESLPRIISPNKESCYLCSHFIRNLTDYNIPGTHGKLYHLWTLPPNNPRDIDYQHFVMDLERTVIKQIEDLVQNKTRKQQKPAGSLPPSTMSAKSKAPALNGSAKASKAEPTAPESRVSETKSVARESRVSKAKSTGAKSHTSQVKPVLSESRVSEVKSVEQKSHISAVKSATPESHISKTKSITDKSRVSEAKSMAPESHVSEAKLVAPESRVSEDENVSRKSQISKVESEVKAFQMPEVESMVPESRTSEAKPVAPESHVSEAKLVAPESRISEIKSMTRNSQISIVKSLAPESRVSEARSVSQKSHISEVESVARAFQIPEVKSMASESRISEAKPGASGSRVSEVKSVAQNSQISIVKSLTPESRVSETKPVEPESHVSEMRSTAQKSQDSEIKPVVPESRVSAPNVPLPDSGLSTHSDQPISSILSDITETDTQVDTDENEEADQKPVDDPKTEEVVVELEEPLEEQLQEIVEENPEPHPEEKVPSDKYESWDSVYSGYTKYVRLSKRLKLYVQYSTAPPNSGTEPLRFKATRVSDEELTNGSMEGMVIYDVAGLKRLICDPGSRHVGLRLGNDTFKIDLSEFEAATSIKQGDSLNV